MTSRLQELPESFWTVLLSFLIFLFAFISPVTYASSDPFFSLVTSQAILEQGTLSLESFEADGQALFDQFEYQIANINGKPTYNYPLGTSLFSLPFVWLARMFGLSMIIEADNFLIQNLISALISALIFVLAYRLCRAYLSRTISMIVALIFLLGTSMISTLGTALWNLDLSIFLIMLALLLVVNFETRRSDRVHPYLLGLILFAAFFTRPSSAFFIFVILLYLLFKDRPSFRRTALSALIPFLGFVLFSYLTYETYLPSYFQASSWYSQGKFFGAMYGILFSPSRGLFVYSPFLLLMLIVGLFSWKEWRNSLLIWLCLLWIGLQTIAVAFTRLWWGGFSYGPRLLADTLPAYLLITAILWSELRQQDGRRRLNFLSIGIVSLGILSIYIHSVQGLFNVKTPLWNAWPSIDEYPEYLSDWRYPQFLVTRDGFHDRLLNHYRQSYSSNSASLDDYALADPLVPHSQANNAFYVGWWLAGQDEYWTEIKDPKILFLISEVDPQLTYQLEFQAQSLGKQDVKIDLNENSLGIVTFPGPSTTYSVEFAGSFLKSGRLNELSLHIPGASTPGIDDFRTYGLRYMPHQLGLLNTTFRISPS